MRANERKLVESEHHPSEVPFTGGALFLGYFGTFLSGSHTIQADKHIEEDCIEGGGVFLKMFSCKSAKIFKYVFTKNWREIVFSLGRNQLALANFE